jgi:putative glycosyltransferase (TIGR04372 family)
MNSFVKRQIEQIRSGGLSLVWEQFFDMPSWLWSRFYLSLPGRRLARIVSRIKIVLYRTVIKFKPGWPPAYEKLGSALLDLDRFEEGMANWGKAVSLQPEDHYPELYGESLKLLHRGQWDMAISVLRLGAKAQEIFVKEHQLDKLGIRFLREWTYAIGHMALLDIYVKMGILGLREDYRPIILDAAPANRAYLSYWQDYIPDIITDPEGVKLLVPLAARLEDHLRIFNFRDGRRLNYLVAILEVQQKWEEEKRGVLLKLKDSDRERGYAALKRLGIGENDWFVGLHVRDTPARNARDCDIATYKMAMKTITDRGGWVIRMGNPSMPVFPPMPHVIDYAHHEIRSDWMDVYLWAAGRFFLGTQSGPYMVPSTFGVPCLLTNSFPMALPLPYQNINIYKLYKSLKENRLMTFAEACASKVGLAETRRYINSVGVELIDNTP